MPNYEETKSFFMADFPRTLFPLETNRILVEHASQSLGDFIYEKITHNSNSEFSFLPQTRAYAAKPDFHLRRTLKLDAVSEFFLYDIIYRHRAKFRKSSRSDRQIFGYRFAAGEMISPAESYRDFRKAISSKLKEYKYCVKLDIAQYFNSIYHHDLVEWFRGHAKSEVDVQFFGRFLREINAGRSIDCLPQGIYPAKIVGSQFLRFIEDTAQLRASESVRFMDDIYLLDDDRDRLNEDFQILQRLIGAKGLSVNSSKTQFGRVDALNIEREVDEIKRDLLQRRGEIILGSGADEDYWEDEDARQLTEEETEYLLDLLDDSGLEEEDAELILAVMRDHSGDVLEHIDGMLRKFPSLIKNIYHFAKHVDDKTSLMGIVRDFVKESPVVTEYQLFWLGKMCEDILISTGGSGDLMSSLLSHRSSTPISKGKILEIPEARFGMPDLREQELNSGASGWLAWCSAVGSRKLSKAKRNHLLMYFSRGSWFNKLVSDCVQTI
jgi:hypothetical protein